MLFQYTWQYILDGPKTQTRRLRHPGDVEQYDDPVTKEHIIQVIRRPEIGPSQVQFEVGQLYAVQPGRGKKTIARIKMTGIRRERLQDISEADALREFPVTSPTTDQTDAQWARKTFMETWDKMHAEVGTRWQDNPEVWVLDFELIHKL